MSTVHYGGHTYSVDRDMIDASVLSSPDENWTLVDPAGHEHYWTWNGTRGTYQSGVRAELPTLAWVIDGYTWYEDDDEPHDYGHHECPQCGARVYPRTKERMEYIAGLTHYSIDGHSVSREEFLAALPPELQK